MAVYYLSDANIVTTTLETLATSAPSVLDSAQGWTVATKAASPINYAAYRPDTTITRTSNDWVTTEPVNFTARGYRTSGILNGVFIPGNWILSYSVKCNTYYAQKGYVKFRLWKSVNANGSSATQITDGWKVSSLIGFTGQNQFQTGTITWNNGSTATFINEYLFLEIEWATNTSGGNNGAIVYWVHNEGAAEKLDTPTWVPAYLSGSANLTKIIASGMVEKVIAGVNLSGDATLNAISASGVVAEVVNIGGVITPGGPDIGAWEFQPYVRINIPAITAEIGMYYPSAVVQMNGIAILDSITASGTTNVGVSLQLANDCLPDIGAWEREKPAAIPTIIASGTMTADVGNVSMSGVAMIAQIIVTSSMNEGVNSSGASTMGAITAAIDMNHETPTGGFFFMF